MRYRLAFNARYTSHETALTILAIRKTLSIKKARHHGVPFYVRYALLQIKPIKIHHLSPRGDKVFHEFFLAICAAVDFC